MSSGRFAFSQAYDPHMYREEEVTLARTTSQQQKNAVNQANGGSKSNGASLQPAMASSTPTSATKNTPDPPQRRSFVFADPVAFRYIVLQGQILIS
jgi:hypothetical protein